LRNTQAVVELVFPKTCGRILNPIARELQIKGWSRAKNEALIALQYERLPELARGREGGKANPKIPPSTGSG
jgi:putative endonuclease